MFTKKKPLVFVKKAPAQDVENAADAKQPGDIKEDKKPVTKKKGKGAKFFANKAARTLVEK